MVWQNKRAGRRQKIRPNKQQTMFCQQRCPSGLEYLGNIFLLGLTTLVGELVDVRAASALEILLEPFQGETGTSLEQDILAAGLGDTVGNIDLLDLADLENFTEQNNIQQFE